MEPFMEGCTYLPEENLDHWGLAVAAHAKA